MTRAFAAVFVVALAASAAGTPPATITAFSGAAPGEPRPPWRALLVPRVKAPEFAFVADGEATVLRVRAVAAAGSLAHALDADPAQRPRLAWRWKVDRVVEKADLSRREGDDFAARVYVFFDMPVAELTLAQRARMELSRLVHGIDLPAAALCYVWDNRNPVGTSAWNPYSDQVRMIVVQSGAGRVGQWAAQARDVEADFRAAFGWPAAYPVPRLTGIALGADTDQTGESATAWFGDVRLEARP